MVLKNTLYTLCCVLVSFFIINGIGKRERQIEQKETVSYVFSATTVDDAKFFDVSIGASGKFYIDWGDGNTETIEKNDTNILKISHSYDIADKYEIKFGGKATGYGSSIAVSFSNNQNLRRIDGSLGKIFGTIPDGSQPLFGNKYPYSEGTFANCANMIGEIPEELFAGVVGAPVENMFSGTFYGCSGLTGNIPENLFAGISGEPAKYMFLYTFFRCSGITGSIPEKLFAGIKGNPALGMFKGTFIGCENLTGNIPENLFSGISGAPAQYMFEATFDGCSGLTGDIPEKLFAGISGEPAQRMFEGMFYGCSGLTGYVPAKLFAGISTDTTAKDQMSGIFSETGLYTVCPAETELYITGFERWFNRKVSCVPI